MDRFPHTFRIKENLGGLVYIYPWHLDPRTTKVSDFIQYLVEKGHDVQRLFKYKDGPGSEKIYFGGQQLLSTVPHYDLMFMDADPVGAPRDRMQVNNASPQQPSLQGSLPNLNDPDRPKRDPLSELLQAQARLEPSQIESEQPTNLLKSLKKYHLQNTPQDLHNYYSMVNSNYFLKEPPESLPEGYDETAIGLFGLLSPDILAEIFQQISIHVIQDLICSVCKTFQECPSFFWKRRSLLDFVMSKERAHQIMAVLPHFAVLKHIILRGFNMEKAIVLSRFPSLKKIDISTTFVPRNFFSAMKNMPNLKVIWMDDSGLQDGWNVHDELFELLQANDVIKCIDLSSTMDSLELFNPQGRWDPRVQCLSPHRFFDLLPTEKIIEFIRGIRLKYIHRIHQDRFWPTLAQLYSFPLHDSNRFPMRLLIDGLEAQDRQAGSTATTEFWDYVTSPWSIAQFDEFVGSLTFDHLFRLIKISHHLSAPQRIISKINEFIKSDRFTPQEMDSVVDLINPFRSKIIRLILSRFGPKNLSQRSIISILSNECLCDYLENPNPIIGSEQIELVAESLRDPTKGLNWVLETRSPEQCLKLLIHHKIFSISEITSDHAVQALTRREFGILQFLYNNRITFDGARIERNFDIFIHYCYSTKFIFQNQDIFWIALTGTKDFSTWNREKEDFGVFTDWQYFVRKILDQYLSNEEALALMIKYRKIIEYYYEDHVSDFSFLDVQELSSILHKESRSLVEYILTRTNYEISAKILYNARLTEFAVAVVPHKLKSLIDLFPEDQFNRYLLESQNQLSLSTILELGYKIKNFPFSAFFLSSSTTLERVELVSKYLPSNYFQRNLEHLKELLEKAPIQFISILSEKHFVSPDMVRIYLSPSVFKDLNRVKVLIECGYLISLMQPPHRKIACENFDVFNFLQSRVPGTWDWKFLEPKKERQEPAFRALDDHISTSYDEAMKMALRLSQSQSNNSQAKPAILETLMMMGYTKEQAEGAAIATENRSAEDALNYLLDNFD